ncbi:hypothetical protein W911_01260 [Hyphomicrobium nitrativorans NL23]|uniref:HD domain-containing protein n=1 Tax=Hyphomicrobium nitrativorans NL23 TaxID=1029756 RepID=V5SG34_9HYPH|nr:hypothetical protein W911_01260 [Hyphomicrobium nitrativorans NL23]
MLPGPAGRCRSGPHLEFLDRVVALLREHGYDAPHLIAAAYLHDTLEDAGATLRQLMAGFGSEGAEFVHG